MGSIDTATTMNGLAAKYEYGHHELGLERPIHLIIIGAGVSTIGAVKMFKERFAEKQVRLTIYEKNHDVGGTWLENRYPGCSCDVPAHGYTYSWEGNPNWSQAYVGSPEIFDYFQGRAKEFGVYELVKLNHAVRKATWDDVQGKWRVEIEDLKAQQVFIDEAEVLINSGGFLNQWRWPDIKGLHDFKGPKLHSARWDDTVEVKDKVVACIGNGSSAIQIVPSIQPAVKKLISIIRAPTWITPEQASASAPEGRDTIFTQEQKDYWATHPREFLTLRKLIEKSINHLYDIHFIGSKVQKDMAEHFSKQMADRLGKKKDQLASKLIPTFGVGCRRITPGKGYLEALAADNVDVSFGGINRITETGVEMQDGTLHEVDVVICATGFDTSFRPAFPLIGKHGDDLRDVWKTDPEAYLSIAVPGFPNYFTVAGPNFTLANGVFFPCIEKIFDYFFKAISKMQNHAIKSFEPKPEAVRDFQIHKDTVMKDMVWSSGCRSWYKNGTVDGRVWGPWPGSSIHFMEVMSEPRWEDYNFEYLKGNRFSYFGIGKTHREMIGGDLSFYLSEKGLTWEDEPNLDDGLAFVNLE